MNSNQVDFEPQDLGIRCVLFDCTDGCSLRVDGEELTTMFKFAFFSSLVMQYHKEGWEYVVVPMSGEGYACRDVRALVDICQGPSHVGAWEWDCIGFRKNLSRADNFGVPVFFPNPVNRRQNLLERNNRTLFNRMFGEFERALEERGATFRLRGSIENYTDQANNIPDRLLEIGMVVTAILPNSNYLEQRGNNKRGDLGGDDERTYCPPYVYYDDGSRYEDPFDRFAVFARVDVSRAVFDFYRAFSDSMRDESNDCNDKLSLLLPTRPTAYRNTNFGSSRVVGSVQWEFDGNSEVPVSVVASNVDAEMALDLLAIMGGECCDVSELNKGARILLTNPSVRAIGSMVAALQFAGYDETINWDGCTDFWVEGNLWYIRNVLQYLFHPDHPIATVGGSLELVLGKKR
jgi:hypothetical protein